MSKARIPPKNRHEVLDLHNEDALAIERMSGALWGGDDEKKRRDLLLDWSDMHDPRNRRDPFMRLCWVLAKYHNTPGSNAVRRIRSQIALALEEEIAQGKIKTIKDVPEELIVKTLVAHATNPRRTITSLKALNKLLEMKGSDLDELRGQVSRMLDRRSERALRDQLRDDELSRAPGARASELREDLVDAIGDCLQHQEGPSRTRSSESPKPETLPDCA